MTNIDCPSCSQPIPVELPIAASVRCAECCTAWDLADPDAQDVPLAA